MGSDSDLPIIRKCTDTLTALGIPFEVHVYSAHRTPREAGDFARNAKKNGFGVMYPQKLGTFALPGAHDLSMKYARAAAPTKAGGTKYKYPAFKACYDVSYGVDGLDFGDWYLPSSFEGCHLMADETLAILAPSISKMGTTAINNSAHRWFAERCYVIAARNFNGNYGYLYYTNVCLAIRVQAVTLLDI